jgi:hypothetical protein
MRQASADDLVMFFGHDRDKAAGEPRIGHSLFALQRLFLSRLLLVEVGKVIYNDGNRQSDDQDAADAARDTDDFARCRHGVNVTVSDLNAKSQKKNRSFFVYSRKSPTGILTVVIVMLAHLWKIEDLKPGNREPRAKCKLTRTSAEST